MLPSLSNFAEIIQELTILKHETKRNLTKTKLKIELTDSSILYVSEVRIMETGWFEYGYQWQKNDNTLIIRWDNAPYHPTISTFPHHKHVGSESNIQPSPAQTLNDILGYISTQINQENE